MGFGREGAEGHRTADEVLHDLLDGFDFVKRDGLRRSKTEEAAQRAAALLRCVHGGRVLLELRVVSCADGLSERGDCLRSPEMLLGVLTVAVLSARGKQDGERRRGRCAEELLFDLPEPEAADAGGGPGEIAVYDVRGEPDDLEYLRRSVAP